VSARRLFSAPRSAPDMRAGMMAVISLMLLLLPWLIQATSGG
jgi:hypothetical protein